MGTETIERPVERRDDTRSTGGTPTLLVVLIAVVALLLGGLAGWLLRGDDGGTDDAVVVNGTELTERQEEMLRVGDEYYAAMRDGDGSKLVSLFVPTGYVTFADESPTGTDEYRVDDGSLQATTDQGGMTSLESYEPVLVYDDTLVYAGFYAGGFIEVIEFTPSGEVLIVKTVTMI